MKINDTWLIFGTSPFINVIRDNIPRLLSKYISIALNFFPLEYNDSDYFIFNDAGCFTNLFKYGLIKPDTKLVVGKDRKSELKTIWYKENQCIIGKDYLVKPHYIFDYELKEPILEECGKLLLIRSIVTAAINYALLQGAKNVVLIGVDLNPEWRHCYGIDHTRGKRQDHIEVIKQKISLFKPFLSLYKANPEANIDLPYLNIKDL